MIGKLKATQDGDGTLFDHVMATYGSVLGRWIGFSAEIPLANLHLTMAQQMGVPAESFADSTGKLRELTDVQVQRLAGYRFSNS